MRIENVMPIKSAGIDVGILRLPVILDKVFDNNEKSRDCYKRYFFAYDLISALYYCELFLKN